ncbi:PIN domain-containing protein [Candidatus Woesearchaeota archaeon]|nr:PIN domain-containing protein [Candidatus Woesearchaeota archaeon]
MAKAILEAGNIEVIDFDSALWFEVLKGLKRTQLKISDLLHYTAASLRSCRSIISFDRDFDRLEIKRVEP